MSLYGRESELAELSEVIESAHRGNGRALRLTGEAGIGKSALLAEAVSGASGVRVLQARALEAELGLPFAVIKDLVDPIVSYLEDAPPVQRAALEGALALGPATPGDRFAAYAGLVSLLAAAAADEPLLLVVDDIQWADRSGAEALLYLSRRIGNDPIVLLVGQRLGEPEPLDLSEIRELGVGGLDPDASRALLSNGHRQIGEEVTEQIVAHAAGNPLALIEIPGTLTEEQLSGAVQLPVPLEGGTRIEELFGRLLERELSPEDRHAVGVAALSMAGDPASIRAALADIDLDGHSLERAEAANFLVLSPTRIEFRHPLLRSAAAGNLDPAATRAAHESLANSLTDADLVERTYHRVRAADAKNEALAQELETAGGQSMTRGAHAVAADLLSRAVEVSEEPPAAIGRGGQAAMAAFFAGDLPGAQRSLERALAGDPPDPTRAQLEGHLGSLLLLLGEIDGALSVLERAGTRVAGHLPDTAAPMLADASLAATTGADCRNAVRLSALAVSAASRSADPVVEANALGAHAHARGLRGENTGDDVDRATQALVPVASPGSPHALRVAVLCNATINEGRRDAAVGNLGPLLKEARSVAGLSAIPVWLVMSGHARFLLGETESALAELSEALSIAAETGQRNVSGLGLPFRAWALAVTGDLRGAVEDAESAIALAGQSQPVSYYAGRALGLVDLARGAHGEVVRRLQPLTDWVWGECAMEHPGLDPTAPLLVESLVALGEAETARRYLDRHVSQCERSGSPVGWAYAARMSGLVMGVTGGRAHEDILVSAERFDAISDPFEAGRSHLLFGEALAGDGSRNAAVEQLQMARDLLGDIRADPWRDRAEQALGALGIATILSDSAARPALTPHERRVADLVADGLKNDEIAEQLFVTRRTVESHLTSVYRKLGIERRTQLAQALRRPSRVPSG